MGLALDLHRQGTYCITKEIIVVSLTNSSQHKSLKQKTPHKKRAGSIKGRTNMKEQLPAGAG